MFYSLIPSLSILLHQISIKNKSYLKTFSCNQVTKNTIKITWSVPEHDGGCKITSYVVESRESTEEDSESFVEVARLKAGVTTYVCTDLAENKKYDLQVRAVNEIGIGEPSMPVSSIMTKDSSGEHK